MKFLKYILIIALLGTVSSSLADAQKKSKKRRPKTIVQKSTSMAEAEELKTVFEIDQSGMENPFIFVIREAATYAELQKQLNQLPAADNVDFSKNAVVVALAGQQPTAGYSISFRKIGDGGVQIDLNAPPTGAITAQVLTSPAKAALVPVAEDKNLKIEMGKIWQSNVHQYNVTKGHFEASGGITGRKIEFALTGALRVMSSGEWMTVFLDLGANTKLQRELTDVATGKIENGQFAFMRIDAGNLVENPHPPLKATGNVGEKEITLRFESLPANVADGFSGQGNLTAVKIK